LRQWYQNGDDDQDRHGDRGDGDRGELKTDQEDDDDHARSAGPGG
jgi:hypothetical protein